MTFLFTCALRHLSLPPGPGALPGGVAPHGVAGDARVHGRLAARPAALHRPVDRLLGHAALGRSYRQHNFVFNILWL